MEPRLESNDELAALRAQLQETEVICHAIRRGEVDAVVFGYSDE